MNKLIDYSLYGDRAVLVLDDGFEISASSINKHSEELFVLLKPHSLVFCLCNNEPGAILGYLTFLDRGIVPVMLDASKDMELMNRLLAIYKPSYIWLPTSVYSPVYGKIEYSAFNYTLTSYSNDPIELHSELAVLLTTSGSTGSPKLVRLSYDNIRSNAESIAEYLNITGRQRDL